MKRSIRQKRKIDRFISSSPPDLKAMANSGQLIKIQTSEQFNELIKSPPNKEKIVFVKFSRPGCKPCKDAVPFLEKWAESFKGQILFLAVEAADTPEIVEGYGIRLFPTFYTYKAGDIKSLSNYAPMVGWLDKLASSFQDHLTKAVDAV